LDSIEEIIIYDHFVLKAAHITFKGKTSFGSKVIFLPVINELKDFCEKNNVVLRYYNI
jgi:hypothetical protein